MKYESVTQNILLAVMKPTELHFHIPSAVFFRYFRVENYNQRKPRY
jgi:hypothetical protein